MSKSEMDISKKKRDKQVILTGFNSLRWKVQSMTEDVRDMEKSYESKSKLLGHQDENI